MFRARKPSLKRPQRDETPRKRARANPKPTPDEKQSSSAKPGLTVKASPLTKSSPAITRKVIAKKATTKRLAKVQSKLRFSVAKNEQPEADFNVASVAEKETVHPNMAQRIGDIAAEAPRETPDPKVAKDAEPQASEPREEKAETTVRETNVAALTSRKRLDFGVDFSGDDNTCDMFDDDDMLSLDSPDRSKFWPPYEPADDLLCRVHDHRLIKPEDDPILDAALELL